MKHKNAPYNQIKDFIDLRDMIYKNAVDFSGSTAFEYERGGVHISVPYKKLREDIDALGAYFLSQGMGNGKKIALVGENCYEWVITYFAALFTASVIVPLDRELSPEELNTLIKAGECDMLVYSKGKAALLPLLEDSGIKILCFDEFESALRTGREILSGGENKPAEILLNIDDTCAIIFTSGTTGSPKGVMLSQRNLLADAKHSLETLKIPSGTVALLPFNHTFGFMAGVICQLWVGFPVYLNAGLKYVLKDIQRAKPGHISVVPLFLENFY